MKIVFFGNEKLATGIQADPVIQDSLRRGGYDIEAIITDKPAVLPQFESKLAVLAAYGRILPDSWLERFPLGIINVHPSLLPIYRGPTPIEQAILDGATKTGVSIMQIATEMDAGPLYKQKSLRLTGQESKQDLADRLQHLGAGLLLEVLPGIFDGSLKPHRQPHVDRDASYTKKITKNDGVIDWSRPAVQIQREVRAYQGWPGSQTNLAGVSVAITDVTVTENSGRAGQAFQHGKQLAVYCGQGAVIIERLKPSGKNEMTGQAFLAGHPID